MYSISWDNCIIAQSQGIALCKRVWKHGYRIGRDIYVCDNVHLILKLNRTAKFSYWKVGLWRYRSSSADRQLSCDGMEERVDDNRSNSALALSIRRHSRLRHLWFSSLIFFCWLHPKMTDRAFTIKRLLIDTCFWMWPHKEQSTANNFNKETLRKG